MNEVITRILTALEGRKTHAVSAALCVCGIVLLSWYVGFHEGWLKTAAPSFALEGGMILLGQGLLGITQTAGRNRIERKLDVNTAITAEASPEAAARVMTPPAGSTMVATTTQQVQQLPTAPPPAPAVVTPARLESNVATLQAEPIERFDDPTSPLAQIRAMYLLGKSDVPLESIEGIIKLARTHLHAKPAPTAPSTSGE